MNQHDKVREAILAITKAEQELKRAELDVIEAERRMNAKAAAVTDSFATVGRRCKAVFGETSQSFVVDGVLWRYEYKDGQTSLRQECSVLVLKEGGE